MNEYIKKLLCAFLAAAAVTVPAFFTASCTDEVQNEQNEDIAAEVTWNVDEDGVLVISGTGAMEDRRKMEDSAWYEKVDFVKSLVVEDGITHIGDRTFAGFFYLENVKLPDSVTSIGNWAFANCTVLKNVSIPTGVTEIGDYAFNCCSSITSIVIPDGVTRIGADAFRYCADLESVSIPAAVTSIDENAFTGCDALVITAPAGSYAEEYAKEKGISFVAG